MSFWIFIIAIFLFLTKYPVAYFLGAVCLVIAGWVYLWEEDDTHKK